MATKINTPITEECIAGLTIGDTVYISGSIFCGRDAVLPKVVQMIQENKSSDYGIELKGSVIFHTAVSPELGMEALYRLEVEQYPAIIAAAHGRSIYEQHV